MQLSFQKIPSQLQTYIDANGITCVDQSRFVGRVTPICDAHTVTQRYQQNYMYQSSLPNSNIRMVILTDTATYTQLYGYIIYELNYHSNHTQQLHTFIHVLCVRKSALRALHIRRAGSFLMCMFIVSSIQADHEVIYLGSLVFTDITRNGPEQDKLRRFYHRHGFDEDRDRHIVDDIPFFDVGNVAYVLRLDSLRRDTRLEDVIANYTDTT
jgi:hypothetical protein